MIKFNNDWDILLKSEFEKEYYKKLKEFLSEEYKHQIIYPEMFDIFNALKYTSYCDTKVVILGQDPYHGENQAHGLCFSVKNGVKKPPSLVNIFKEIQNDLGNTCLKDGDLTNWAKQGVLLLNTILTVRQGQPNSHKDKGWEMFTDYIISLLDEKNEPVVFLLWGKNAQSKIKLITNDKHKILIAPHPSPLSAYNGFFGCKHFSKTNEFLKYAYSTEIQW